MLKTTSQLESVINEKVIRLTADYDTDINVIRAALQQFNQFIDQIEEAVKNKQSEEAKIDQMDEQECLQS